MTTKKHTRPLTRTERAFLRDALIAVEIPTLLKGRHLSPEAAAHITADYCRSLLNEYRLLLSEGVSP